MGFVAWRKRVRAGGSTGPGELDRLAPEECLRIRKELEAGKLDALKALLAGLPPGAWSDRTWLIAMYSQHLRRDALDAWVATEPESQLARLVRGRHAIKWAWDARGGGRGSGVGEDAARLFVERLELAREDLLHAAELDPRDPAPWAFLITVDRGLSEDLEVAREHFGLATVRDPENFTAHEQMVTLLTEKWLGSHDQMFEFARAAAEKAPPGSDLGALVLLAHTERWGFFRLFENDDKGAEAYAKDPSVRLEIAHAWDRVLAAPELRNRRSTVMLLNHAAAWLHLLEDHARLKPAMQRLGDARADMPWEWFTFPRTSWRKARELAGLE
jgi:hypothetical protein